MQLNFNQSLVRRRIWAQGSWKLHPGVFRVSNWEPNFNPTSQFPLKVQVWIRLFIGMEYWHPINLMEIAKAVGHPIKIDRATLAKTNGQFAIILVEVDYNFPFTTDIHIQRLGYSFWAPVFYERLPDLCDRCLCFGHKIESCRRREDQTVKFPKDEPIGHVHIIPFRARENRKDRREVTNPHNHSNIQKEEKINTLFHSEAQAIHQTPLVHADDVGFADPQSSATVDLVLPSAAVKDSIDVTTLVVDEALQVAIDEKLLVVVFRGFLSVVGCSLRGVLSQAKQNLQAL